MSADDFAALEHATPIVQVADGVATTTSMRIANGTQVQHKNLRELIEDNLPDFEEFGRVRFETAKPPEGTNGGRPVKYAILNEEHATLLLTYMRNNDVVRDFKKRLVREFYAMRKALATPLQGNELLAAAVLESQKVIEARDARIHQLESKVTTDAPKVSYVDTYVTDADLLSFSTVASSNNVTGYRFGPAAQRTEPTSELLFAAANQLDQVRNHLHFDHPREEYLSRLVPELRARAMSFVKQYD